MSNDTNIQLEPTLLLNKKQNHFVAKCCTIAGILFAIIFAISFVIARLAFVDMSIENQNTLIIIGSISLVIGMVFSIILSFKGIRASYFLIISTIVIFCASFILMFSSYFSLLGNDILFYSLAFTALAMLITGLISFLIPDKVAFGIMKIASISFIVYLLVSIIGSLIINFTWTSTNFEVWQIIVTAIIGLAFICSTISTFYSMRKQSEFMNITTIDATTANKMLLLQSFSLLSSIVMMFILALRIFMMVDR